MLSDTLKREAPDSFAKAAITKYLGQGSFDNRH